jgi:hypothetical protein
MRPRRVSMTSTTFAVEAETRSRRPFGESAMWSARTPPTATRHAIRPLATSMATTSAKLGREKKIRRPSLEGKPSSTSWSWPSPISARMPSKANERAGSARISAIRRALSGTTFRRLTRWNVPRSMTSAVPAQLLLTTRTSRSLASAAGGTRSAAAAASALMIRRR